MGFFRADVEADHPQFGKPIPCDHSSHATERLAKMAKVSGLRKDELTTRLADIVVNDDNLTMVETANEFIKDPYGWLYIWGGPGNAKSVVLTAIINQLNEDNYGTVLYTKFGRIIDYMRDAFTEQKERSLHGSNAIDNGYIARFEQLKAIKVLAIDEMDKVRSTAFADEFRFDFLDERYRQGIAGETVTLFAGNTDPSTFDEPIYDRIRDGRFQIVHNAAGSARPFMRRGQ